MVNPWSRQLLDTSQVCHFTRSTVGIMPSGCYRCIHLVISDPCTTRTSQKYLLLSSVEPNDGNWLKFPLLFTKSCLPRLRDQGWELCPIAITFASGPLQASNHGVFNRFLYSICLWVLLDCSRDNSELLLSQYIVGNSTIVWNMLNIDFLRVWFMFKIWQLYSVFHGIAWES